MKNPTAPRRRRALAALAIAFGCRAAPKSDAVDPMARLPELCARQDSLYAAVGSSPTLDDEYEIMARLLPGGYAGYDGRATVMVRVEAHDALRRTATALLTCTGRRASFLVHARDAAARAGRYDWVQLRDWQRTLHGSVPTEWFSSDIDELRNQLSFEFPSDAARSRFLAAARRLGVPARALHTELGARPTLLQSDRNH